MTALPVRGRACFPALEALLTRKTTTAAARPARVLPLATPRPPRAFLTVLLLLPLAACAVGPDFKKPAAPEAGDYTAKPLSTTVATDIPGGSAQHFIKGADIASDWWSLFHSQPLNDLIE